MKIKADFVTNSSTTMYIIAFNEKYIRKNFEEHFTLKTGEYFNSFDNILKLIKYTQQRDVDWITEATKMPIEFWSMSKDEFKECEEILDEGKFAVHLQIDRNYYERTERIEDIIRENGGEIRLIGSD
jgi:hypothetical protein